MAKGKSRPSEGYMKEKKKDPGRSVVKTGAATRALSGLSFQTARLLEGGSPGWDKM